MRCPRCIEVIANRLKNDYSQCPDMWQKIQLIVIKIISLGYNDEGGASPSSIYRYADAECSWFRCAIPAIIPYCLSLCEMALRAAFWRTAPYPEFINGYPYVA
ncbi:hypothetical protein [Symbiopectobacterium sp. RP]|uniref:hypothetical protein n=1 Tax=Symbiopectobacterium sp. RP TaxID=3248553 RepID=UPI003D27EA74